MAIFTLTIERDNAAFSDGNDAGEIVRILRKLADRLEIENTDYGGTVNLHDHNGNRVGFAKWEARAKVQQK